MLEHQTILARILRIAADARVIDCWGRATDRREQSWKATWVQGPAAVDVVLAMLRGDAAVKSSALAWLTEALLLNVEAEKGKRSFPGFLCAFGTVGGESFLCLFFIPFHIDFFSLDNIFFYKLKFALILLLLLLLD